MEREVTYRAKLIGWLVAVFAVLVSLTVLAVVSADEKIQAQEGAYVKIPIPNATDASEFKLRPDSALMLPTREWGSGKCVVIFSSPKRGTFYLFVTYAESAGEVFDIQVGEPEPDPTPVPPNPPPLTGLAKQVYDFAAKLNDPITASAIADNYRLMAKSISDGSYDIGEFREMQPQIYKWLYAQNHPLSEKRPAWSALFDLLESEDKKSYADGKIKTVRDMATRFAAVESGLRRAAQ